MEKNRLEAFSDGGLTLVIASVAWLWLVPDRCLESVLTRREKT